MKYALIGIICIFLLIPFGSHCQFVDSAVVNKDIPKKLSDKYINALGRRSAEYERKIDKSTLDYLDKLKAQEQILQQQLSKVDSNKALQIFNGSKQAYDKIENELRNNSENVLKSCGKYIPGIDSALTSLKFLQQNENITGKFGNNFAQVNAALSKVKALEDQFKKTDNVEDFIKQREQFLQQQLSSYQLPGLQQYNQQAAYYAQQINEFKEAWDDPSKAEEKALKLLNKLPAFQDFMKKNSMIAGLFNMPEDYSTSGLGSLQTKEQVQKLIQQQMTFMGPNGAQAAQQNIGDAQSTLSSLRDKLNSGSSELTMPDGQGNSQHTKTFLKRIEYGMNIQNTRASGLLPTTTYFAVTAGYKLNEKSVIGIGISYNVGWGTDIQHIHISNQGIGLRSYLDVKLKGSFFATGGYEKNYNKVFTSLNQIAAGNLWQTSGLIGISKIVSLRGNLLKKTKLQLLWNFLSYSQLPQTQPLLFRVGYNF